MKTLFHTIAAIALSLISIASYGYASDDDYDFEDNLDAKKFFSKELVATKQTVLDVQNSHGNIKVVPWNQSKVLIEVYVENFLDEDLQKRLKIDLVVEGNTIKAETKHLKRKINYQTNYVIHAPMAIESFLKNRHGDIIINGDMTNFCNIDVQFGNLYAKSLKYDNADRANVINISYGDATLTSTTWLNAKVSFGSLKMDACHAIGVNSNFGDVNVKSVKFANASTNFSTITLESVYSIKGKMQHSDLRVSALKTNISLVVEFCDVKVNSISNNFSNIVFQSKFTEGKLNFEPNSEFIIDGKGSYTGFKFNNLGDDSSITGDEFKKTVGKKPQKQVKITAKFGNWQITRD